MIFDVLVVEDSPDVVKKYRTGIACHVSRLGRFEVQIEVAATLGAAKAKLKNLQQYAVVVFDGCVPGDQLNTLKLIEWAVKRRAGLRRGERILLLSASGSATYRKRMANVSGGPECPKKDVPEVVVGHLIRLLTK